MTDEKVIETRMRVLTWNVWWRFGPWEKRQPAVIETISGHDPDIIALQEVWSDEASNFSAHVAQQLGYHYVFEQSMEIKGFGFGNALLSRWPIVEHESTMLFGQAETGEGRLALFARVDGPRGAVPVFSTHLNWKFEQSHVRQLQVTDLAKFVDRMRPWEFPPVICGDFNAEPTSEELRMLTGLTNCPVDGLVFHDAWAVAGGGGPGLTWDNANPYAVLRFEPDRRIDYILVGWPAAGGAGHIVHCEVTGNRPVDGVWPSDHHAVLAELRY